MFSNLHSLLSCHFLLGFKFITEDWIFCLGNAHLYDCSRGVFFCAYYRNLLLVIFQFTHNVNEYMFKNFKISSKCNRFFIFVEDLTALHKLIKLVLTMILFCLFHFIRLISCNDLFRHSPDVWNYGLVIRNIRQLHLLSDVVLAFYCLCEADLVLLIISWVALTVETILVQFAFAYNCMTGYLMHWRYSWFYS